METRLNIFENSVSRKFLKYLTTSYRIFSDTSLVSEELRELVSLRISQINGCGFCVDMHTKEATHMGATPLRLSLVAVWRESNVFTEAERAAFELAEQGTRVADGGAVSDEVWANAAKHYSENQLAALVALISFMNAINRVNVITRQHGGDYQLGQLSQFG